jgi:hypothetical protein
LKKFLFDYFKIASTVFTEYRYLIKPLTLISRETNDEKIPDFVKKINTNIQQKLTENIITIARRSNPAITEESVEFALLWVGASLREKFLYKVANSDQFDDKDQAFLVELSKAISRYLEVNEC